MDNKPCSYDTASGKLVVFTSKNKQVVQIQMQVSHVEAVLERWSLLKIDKNNFPWITTNIRRLCRKKRRRFNKAKRSHRSKDWQEYKNDKKHTLQSIRRFHWNYVNSIPQDVWNQTTPIPSGVIWLCEVQSAGLRGCGQRWCGSSKLVGKLYSEAKDKADILNKQFKYVLRPRSRRILRYIF